EGCVLRRRQMLYPLHIIGPFNVVRILRTGDNEIQMRQLPGWLEQQTFKGRLPVRSVGSKIAKIPMNRVARCRIMCRVHRAIERNSLCCPKISLQLLKGAPASEGKVEIEH